MTSKRSFSTRMSHLSSRIEKFNSVDLSDKIEELRAGIDSLPWATISAKVEAVRPILRALGNVSTVLEPFVQVWQVGVGSDGSVGREFLFQATGPQYGEYFTWNGVAYRVDWYEWDLNGDCPTRTWAQSDIESSDDCIDAVSQGPAVRYRFPEGTPLVTPGTPMVRYVGIADDGFRAVRWGGRGPWADEGDSAPCSALRLVKSFGEGAPVLPGIRSLDCIWPRLRRSMAEPIARMNWWTPCPGVNIPLLGVVCVSGKPDVAPGAAVTFSADYREVDGPTAPRSPSSSGTSTVTASAIASKRSMTTTTRAKPPRITPMRQGAVRAQGAGVVLLPGCREGRPLGFPGRSALCDGWFRLCSRCRSFPADGVDGLVDALRGAAGSRRVWAG